MNKFKEEDFQFGSVFENKLGRYEVVVIDSTHIQIKYTNKKIDETKVEQLLRKNRKSFVHYLNEFNSSSEYPFYKVC